MTDTLWAPWRMDYIRSARAGATGCIFCAMLPAGDDRARLILHRGTRAFVVMNRYPYNPGHLMVVPHRHGEALHDVPPADWGEVMALAGRAVTCLRAALKSEGANCGINLGRVAGAGITDHVHFHIVPRWPGDTNFLPVLGATKTMPEYLSETYDTLLPHFAELV